MILGATVELSQRFAGGLNRFKDFFKAGQMFGALDGICVQARIFEFMGGLGKGQRP